jgi:hypothetical protein
MIPPTTRLFSHWSIPLNDVWTALKHHIVFQTRHVFISFSQVKKGRFMRYFSTYSFLGSQTDIFGEAPTPDLKSELKMIHATNFLSLPQNITSCYKIPKLQIRNQYTTTLQMKGRWESNLNVWFPFMYSQKWNCYFQNRIIMSPSSIHSYICERFKYFQDRSAYSAAGQYVNRSWEYINRSPTHECGNWDWGRVIPRKGIHKWNFRGSVR